MQPRFGALEAPGEPTNMGISFTATAQEAPDVEEGTYEADFDGVEEGPAGQFGPSIKWLFTAYVEGEPTKVNGLTSTSASVKGKAYEWLTAILGRQPAVGEQIDFDSLKGNRCKVLIEKNAKDWPGVAKVYAAKKGK